MPIWMSLRINPSLHHFSFISVKAIVLHHRKLPFPLQVVNVQSYPYMESNHWSNLLAALQSFFFPLAIFGYGRGWTWKLHAKHLPHHWAKSVILIGYRDCSGMNSVIWTFEPIMLIGYRHCSEMNSVIWTVEVLYYPPANYKISIWKKTFWS